MKYINAYFLITKKFLDALGYIKGIVLECIIVKDGVADPYIYQG